MSGGVEYARRLLEVEADNERLRADLASWRKGVKDANRIAQREQARGDGLAAVVLACTRRAEAAEAREAEARAVLRSVESVEHSNAVSTWRACPSCHHVALHGEQPHYADCRLDRAARVTGGEEG